MKTYLLLLFVALQGCVAFAQNKPPYLTKSLSGAGIKNVYARTSGGGITVSGSGNEQPRVEVYVTGNNSWNNPTDAEIKKRLEEDYSLDISVANGEVRAIAKNKHNMGGWDWKKSLSISFKIYVPQTVTTDVETSGGSIHMDNLKGNESFSTSGGSLHVDHLVGIIKGRTSGGSIEVSHSSENIDLETSGGSINASDCNGKIRLETSGGSLHLQNLKGSIKAETSGGGIHGDKIDGELITETSGGSIGLTDMACSLSASTSGGSVSAQLRSIGKFVKIDCSSGNVSLELPAKSGMNLNVSAGRINHPENLSFNGEWDKDRVKGALNGGGVPVSIEAGSSHVDLKFN